MLVVLLIGVLASTSAVLSLNVGPPSRKYPPAVTVTFPNREYKELVHSVKEVDFKNLEYHLSGERVRLRNGSMRGTTRRLEGDESWTRIIEVSLGQSWYFDFQDGQPQHALVSLDFFAAAGSSSDSGFILLFEIADGHPVISQQFEYDRQAPGTGARFHPDLGALTIKARAQDDSPHCCPRNLETDEFKWQGQRFKLIHRKIRNLAKPE